MQSGGWRPTAAGINPGSLWPAPSQSDDTCADLAPAEVTGWFAEYAGAARANSRQLDDLVASVRTSAAHWTATLRRPNKLSN